MFSFVAEFVLKIKTSQSINELEARKAELEKSVNQLSAIENSISVTQDELDKLNEVADKHRQELNKHMTELEAQVLKREKNLEILIAETKTLTQQRSNIKGGFVNTAASDATNPKHKKVAAKRRTALLNEFAKSNGYNMTSIRRDAEVIETRITSNGKF